MYVCLKTDWYKESSAPTMNCRKILIKIYHLTSNLLPHYHAKVECSTLLLYSTLFSANVMQNRLFTRDANVQHRSWGEGGGNRPHPQ